MPTSHVDPSPPSGERGPGNLRPRRPTSVDVAREAGLSRATVGYVLNEVPHQTIPERTRQRVREAAAKLGYTPSAAARSLRSGRSEIVLCLMPDWPVGHAVISWLDAVSARLEGRGYTFVTHPRSPSSRPVADILKAITPEVVIVFEDLPQAERDALAVAGVRVVPAAGAESQPGTRALEGEQIGLLQAHRLAALGRRQLAYAEPDEPRTAGFSGPRLAGIRAGCRALGLPAPAVAKVALDGLGADGRSFGEAVLGWRAAGIDGICCYNDEVAIGILGACARLGIAIPHEVAVIGVDNTPLAALVFPALTSIEISADAAAERMAALLVGAPAPGYEPEGPRLVVRASG